MRVLSIRQPWAWLIANGLKDIENRDWATSYRGSILIHAGKNVDPGCFDGDRAHSPEFYLAGGDLHIMGRVPPLKSDYETGGIVGVARLTDIVTEHTSPWFRGRYGFVLKDARPLPFIPLRGQLGLFDAPSDVLEIVAREFERKVSA